MGVWLFPSFFVIFSVTVVQLPFLLSFALCVFVQFGPMPFVISFAATVFGEGSAPYYFMSSLVSTSITIQLISSFSLLHIYVWCHSKNTHLLCYSLCLFFCCPDYGCILWEYKSRSCKCYQINAPNHAWLEGEEKKGGSYVAVSGLFWSDFVLFIPLVPLTLAQLPLSCSFFSSPPVFGSSLGSSSPSTWLWPETTARSVCGATAGLRTPWTTATTLCPAPFTPGESSCTVRSHLSSYNAPAHIQYITQTSSMHFICSPHTTVVFCSPAESQYSANLAAGMQRRCRAEGYLQSCYSTHDIRATKHTVHPPKLSCHPISLETRSRNHPPPHVLVTHVIHLAKLIRFCSPVLYILWIYDVIKMLVSAALSIQCSIWPIHTVCHVQLWFF